MRALIPRVAFACGALALLAACETRVVDLALPDAGPDAGAAVCELIRRVDGTVCQVCAVSGNVVSGKCDKALDPPDLGTCKVLPGEPRCLACFRAGASYNPCLRCGLTTKTPGGQVCRLCAWTDLPLPMCQECASPDGTITLDECAKVRREAILGLEPVKVPGVPGP